MDNWDGPCDWINMSLKRFKACDWIPFCAECDNSHQIAQSAHGLVGIKDLLNYSNSSITIWITYTRHKGLIMKLSRNSV
jgi:hypothetical protein